MNVVLCDRCKRELSTYEHYRVCYTVNVSLHAGDIPQARAEDLCLGCLEQWVLERCQRFVPQKENSAASKEATS